MTADGTYTAVLDRFEQGSGERKSGETGSGRETSGDLAVFLLESDNEVVAERAIPTWRLPEDARRQDAVLELSVKNGFVVSMEYDPDATEQRTSEAQSRFDRLAERPGEESEGQNEDDS